MSLPNTHWKLTLILTLGLVGPACNNQKAEEIVEEETADAESEMAPTRDNRNSQSGDAAFIKVFPDGDIVVSRGETATVSAPAAASTPAPAPTSSAPGETSAPTQETAAPAPTESPTTTPQETAPPASEPAPASPAPETPAAETPAAPTETVSQPAADPIPVVNEPAPAPAPAPIASDEHPIAKDADDTSRPVLTLNESNASTIISVLPKENKSIVAIGKHNEFAPGPYMILAKWTNDSKKVKVNVASIEAKEKNCAIDDSASQGEWKSIGVFYLTKNAKVVITNAKNSSFSVKNELLLKPVIAENVNAPSKFKCLDGQIDGHGLLAFP